MLSIGEIEGVVQRKPELEDWSWHKPFSMDVLLLCRTWWNIITGALLKGCLNSKKCFKVNGCHVLLVLKLVERVFCCILFFPLEFTYIFPQQIIWQFALHRDVEFILARKCQKPNLTLEDSLACGYWQNFRFHEVSCEALMSLASLVQTQRGNWRRGRRSRVFGLDLRHRMRCMLHAGYRGWCGCGDWYYQTMNWQWIDNGHL